MNKSMHSETRNVIAKDQEAMTVDPCCQISHVKYNKHTKYGDEISEIKAVIVTRVVR